MSQKRQSRQPRRAFSRRGARPRRRAHWHDVVHRHSTARAFREEKKIKRSYGIL